MATTTTIKYFVTNVQGDDQDYLDFGLSYGGGGISTTGANIQYHGSGRVDDVFIRPGMTADLTDSGSGVDKIYLLGSLADYTLSVDTQINTLTLTRNVAGQTESVTVAGGTSLNYDTLLFANGMVSTNALYSAVANNSTRPTPDNSETSLAPKALPTQSATIRAYANNPNGETFAAVKPGVNLIINGGSGVDKVYVADGSNVDATNTGSGVDLIYLRGNWADYTKTSVSGVLTFTRSVGADTETVQVTAGSSATADRVVFADGSAMSNEINALVRSNPGAPSSGIGGSGFNPSITTPLHSDGEIAAALGKIAALAQSNQASSSNPSLSDYAIVGVQGITAANLAQMNDALNSAPVDASKADTAVKLQTIVDAIKAIDAAADGQAGNTATALTGAQYSAVGVTGVSGVDAPGNALHLLNDVVDGSPLAAVNTTAELQALADAAKAVQAQAVGTAGLTMDQLGLLGVRDSNGVLLSNSLDATTQAAILAKIAAAADSGLDTDTLAELQALMNTVNHAPTINNPTVGSGANGLFGHSSVLGTAIEGPAIEDSLILIPDGEGGYQQVNSVVGWTARNTGYENMPLYNVLKDYSTWHYGPTPPSQDLIQWRDSIDGGTSLNGGKFATLLSSNAQGSVMQTGMKTTLSNLVVGQTYVYGLQWQQMRELFIWDDQVNYYNAGGQLVISVDGHQQVYTSSGLSDGWNNALYSFTATSSTETLEVFINGLAGITDWQYPVLNGWAGYGGQIAIDSLSAAQVKAVNPTVAGAGVTSNALFGAVSDIDTNASLKGWAITHAAADGAGNFWQYSSDNGVTWQNMDSASTSQAIYLSTSDLIRWTGLKGTNTELNAKAVDDTGPALHATNALAGQVDTTQSGGATAFSGNTAVLAAHAPPVLLDLNRDGEIKYSQITMDMDGQRVNTAWVGASDGMLFWDKYADGTLHGSEQYVFGRNAGSDLSGVQVKFDSNGDFLFNDQDASFSQFGVWQDANQNGRVDSGEYHTLNQLGIASLSLSSVEAVQSPAKGVNVVGQSSAALAGGGSMLVADVNFEYTRVPLPVQPSNSSHDTPTFSQQWLAEQATCHTQVL